MRFRLRVILPIAALLALLGFWLGKAGENHFSAKKEAVHDEALTTAAPVQRSIATEETPLTGLEEEVGPFEGQRVLLFRDAEAMARFLKKAGNRISILGRIDALSALRVGFHDWREISDLLGGEGEITRIMPISTPPLPSGSVQAGAQALNAQLLEWLGVTTDHSNWGEGVRIAVLDTGVADHSAFGSDVKSINLVNPPSDLSEMNGHGTAVASMIIGADEQTPGVAPSAELLSVRVADDSGSSDSFLLAQGIIAAVDAGAQLINISMGGFGQSAVLENAVEYARERGVLIFAAAGNNGMDQVFYPAAYEGVIAVGSVDAVGEHLDFSNTGLEMDVVAPGYGINAAMPGDQAASVSGTSFSTPIAVGAVAAVMTATDSGKLTSAQAWTLVQENLNDAGAAGDDSSYGMGMLDIGRVLDSETPGIRDAAVSSQRILPADSGNPYGQVEILIQNRGTEILVNTTVEITAGGNRITSNITTLAPNEVRTIRVPITGRVGTGTTSLVVDSRVSLLDGTADAKPSNDRRITTYESKSK